MGEATERPGPLVLPKTDSLDQKVPSAWGQWWLLVRQGLKAELADAERLISPVLFSVTLLILFSFAMGDVGPDLRPKVYLAGTFLTLLFSLQLCFSRLFDPDRQDLVFDLLRCYPVSHTAWYLSKYVLILILGAATLVPTMLFGAFLHHSVARPVFSWTVMGIASLALAGLGALGVLLSTITLKAHGRQILYPLLYFPLTTPVLLAAVQASLTVLDRGAVDSTAATWMWLLLGFDAIYFVLGVLLYPELVDDQS